MIQLGKWVGGWLTPTTYIQLAGAGSKTAELYFLLNNYVQNKIWLLKITFSKIFNFITNKIAARHNCCLTNNMWHFNAYVLNCLAQMWNHLKILVSRACIVQFSLEILSSFLKNICMNYILNISVRLRSPE